MVKNVQKLLRCLSGSSDNLHSAADFLYCAFRPVAKAYLIQRRRRLVHQKHTSRRCGRHTAFCRSVRINIFCRQKTSCPHCFVFLVFPVLFCSVHRFRNGLFTGNAAWRQKFSDTGTKTGWPRFEPIDKKLFISPAIRYFAAKLHKKQTGSEKSGKKRCFYHAWKYGIWF